MGFLPQSRPGLWGAGRLRRGYEDGAASFFLAPGLWLHYRRETNKYGHNQPCFTLLTGDNDQPVPVTGMEQIRHHLTARAAGLAAAPVTADTTADARQGEPA